MARSLLPAKGLLATAAFSAMLLFPAVMAVEASMIGGESGAYLRAPLGATALAMGGAQSASCAYAAAWWNPALAGKNRERIVALGAGIRPFGQTDGFASLEFRVPPRVGMGLLFLYRGDPFVSDLYDDNEQPLDAASFTSLTGKIALSYQVNRRLSAGLTISILYEKLPAGYHDSRIVYASANSIGSLDFSLHHVASDRLALSFQLKDIGALLNWNFASGYDYSVPYDDRILPTLLAGSSFTGTLLERPFRWNCDLRVYLLTGDWKKIDRPQVVLSNGIEWQYWETVFLRAGIGDFALNGDIVSDFRYYRKYFAPRIGGGISVDLGVLRRGMRLNYGCSTDKVWAGIDQQLDITLTF